MPPHYFQELISEIHNLSLVRTIVCKHQFRSILANAETRKRLDRDMSATISNKIDDNYHSVQEFLNSSVNNGEDSPIPTFRVKKKRD